MKIGLLTFHDTTNFGSWLQTYALYKKVKQLGHSVEIIDYKCEGIKYREKLSVDRLSMMPVESVLLQIKKQVCFWRYLHKYMKLSKRKYSKKNIDKANGRYDLYLLGSDLVWDLNITYGDETYLFDFLSEEAVRCAYAASSGRDYILDSQRDIFKKYLKYFKTIAVREEGMKEDIGKLWGKKVQHVCDPTLLLDRNEWEKFIGKRTIKEKYVLLYFVDGKGNLSRLAKKYAREHGFVAINKDFNIDKDNMIHPTSVKEFLSMIFYAEKIYTASYHGMMYSVTFNKQFVFYPFAPATRMVSAARLFGIETQNIESKEFDNEALINYEDVKDKLNGFREKSIDTLKEMLG